MGGYVTSTTFLRKYVSNNIHKKNLLPYRSLFPQSEPDFVNHLRSQGIDSQHGGIDSIKSISGLLKRLRIRALCWNFRTIYGGQEPSWNRVVVPARPATQAGGIDSLESISGLLKSLKIPAAPVVPPPHGGEFSLLPLQHPPHLSAEASIKSWASQKAGEADLHNLLARVRSHKGFKTQCDFTHNSEGRLCTHYTSHMTQSSLLRAVEKQLNI